MLLVLLAFDIVAVRAAITGADAPSARGPTSVYAAYWLPASPLFRRSRR
jgi:hypothetical protein